MADKCSKCNSDKIIPKAKVIDRGDYNSEGDLVVAIDENPDALIFKERFRTTTIAKVCGNCGFIEFYANNPNELYQAYQNQLANNKTDQ